MNRIKRRGFLRTLSVLLLAMFIGLSASAAPVINEIHYNSPGDPDIEFIEIYNPDPDPIDLTGWFLLDDDPAHPICPLQATLAQGDYLVVAGDSLLFAFFYPGVENVNPFYFNPSGTGFSLGNSDDTVNLYDETTALVDFVSYTDGNEWPSSPDGDGPSLELINPLLDNASPFSWDPSPVIGGSPGIQNGSYQVDQSPTCRAGARDILLPTSSDEVTITVTAFDYEALVSVELFYDIGAGYGSLTMMDDGLHGDGAAGDSIFGATIPPQASGTLVRYYAIATDDLSQTDPWPGDAPTEYRAYTVDHILPELRITEIMADNTTGITDEYGQFEDWIEIYNYGTTPVPLGGMFLSDESDRRRLWTLPEFTLGVGDYLIVWTDSDIGQGAFHASFKLASAGEYIGLYDSEDHGNALISGTEFGPMSPNIPVGLLEAEGLYEYLSIATPGTGNSAATYFSTICINELMTTSLNGGVDDWVEIYNRGDAPVDIGGWHVSDNRFNPTKWSFPPGTVLEAGEYVAIDELTLGFSFSSSGDEEVVLCAADSTVGIDFIDYGPQNPDISEGRYPDGSSFWYTLASPSSGAANAPPIAVPAQLPEPGRLRLLGNHPNPFNPKTNIRFGLDRAARVEAVLFSAEGRRVRTLFVGQMSAGDHILVWDGRGSNGEVLPSGVYLLSLRSGKQSEQSKLLLLK